VPRSLVWPAYGVLVLVWSSTWVAIKFGLEGTPPLLGAGVRFALAGVLLLGLARLWRRDLRTDRTLAAILALLPFALTYGLIYWAEQYVPSGLAAVLFGVMPIYVAVLAAFLLADEAVRGRLFAGLAIALAGLVVAFGETLELGHAERAVLGAAAVLLSPIASAIGNVSIRLRARDRDPVVLNGWAMLGAGAVLLAVSAPTEAWGRAVWDATAVGAIAYLAVLGSAVTFVLLTMLIRELGAIPMSYLPLILPFGALVFGWALYDERITPAALAGAGLVAAGLLVAQGRVPGRAVRAVER
jgi:drug/metabolite transporter (DMT)-like permease